MSNSFYYIILTDSAEIRALSSWKSLTYFYETFGALRQNDPKTYQYIEMQDSAKSIENLRHQIELAQKSVKNKTLVIVHLTIHFHLFKLTRQKWFRDGDFQHLFIIIGGLLINPYKTFMNLAPLKSRPCHFLFPLDNITKQAKLIVNTSCMSSFALPFGKFETNKKQFSEKEKRKFCFGGRLVESKGIINILKAFSKVQLVYPESELHIAGFYHPRSFTLHGIESNQEKIQDLIHSNKNHNVFFHGDLNKSQWIDLLTSCDVFLYPTTTYEEDFALSALEAKCVGLPMIATNWAVMNNIYDKTTDRLIEVDISEGLAKISTDDLAKAMLDYQKVDLKISDFKLTTFYREEWIRNLFNQIPSLDFSPFEFTASFMRYKDVFIEHGYTPYESLKADSEANNLHEYFYKDFN